MALDQSQSESGRAWRGFRGRQESIPGSGSDPDEERWRIVGLAGNKVLFVALQSETTMSHASSRHAKRTSGKKEPTLVRRRLKYGKWYAVDADGNERLPPERVPDWSRLNAMTEEELEAAARSD